MKQPYSSPDAIKTALGVCIRRLRTAAVLSQMELANKAQLHWTYIGGIERGERNVSIVNIARITAALDVSLADLFRDVDLQLKRT